MAFAQRLHQTELTPTKTVILRLHFLHWYFVSGASDLRGFFLVAAFFAAGFLAGALRVARLLEVFTPIV